MYDIDNSRRSSSLHQKLHKSHASCWISLTWLPENTALNIVILWLEVDQFAKCSHLHNIGVARDEARGKHPEGNHRGKVERSNAGTNAKRNPETRKFQDTRATGNSTLGSKYLLNRHLWLVRSMSLLMPVRVSPSIKVVFAHRDSTTWGFP